MIRLWIHWGGAVMRGIYLPIVAIGLISLMVWDLNLAANLPPVKGGVLPLIRLPVPEDPDEKEYLGLSGGSFFRIPQIKAKVVIIEIFSMYCPKCQKIAPEMDDLYYLIESAPDLRNKIKLIGIGAGNSRYEVDVFKKTFNTPFPLFPDNDFTIHKALGDVRSPYFIVIKINRDGTNEVVHSELDSFEEARAFLELIVTASGLK
ncbi:MAG: redoxin domain-containing protein [Deltaproteobacteria bacterium]|nr:redoxin domain-containing protein [Deltaproteobacteria bacterium]